MPDKLAIYYTFRLIQEHPFRRIEVAKWEELGSAPVATYEVFPDGRKGSGQCSCPAFRVCKHIKCVEEAYKDGKAQELWRWKWDEKNGWQESDDLF